MRVAPGISGTGGIESHGGPRRLVAGNTAQTGPVDFTIRHGRAPIINTSITTRPGSGSGSVGIRAAILGRRRLRWLGLKRRTQERIAVPALVEASKI